MQLKQLRLANFRNFNTENISFHSPRVLLSGDNGQGKTNLLEAIYFLSEFKSFRTNKTSALIQNGKDGFSLDAIFDQSSVESTLHIEQYDKHKSLVRDGKKLSSQSEHRRNFPVIFLSNEDILLGSGSPSLRRNIIDRQLSLLSSPYRNTLRHYQSLIDGKNKLLKQEKSLKDINFLIAEKAALLHEARLKYIHSFQALFQKLFSTISAYPDSDIELKYFDSNENSFIHELPDKETVLKQIESLSSREEASKRALGGAHRVDYQFYWQGSNAKYRASQGQMRLIVYAFKLTLAQHIRKHLKREPAWIIDDVFADLDDRRVGLFFEFINHLPQVFIASANKNLIQDHLKAFQVMTLKNGACVHG